MGHGWWTFLRLYPWRNYWLRIGFEVGGLATFLSGIERFLPALVALNDWLRDNPAAMVALVAYFATIRFVFYDLLVADQFDSLSGKSERTQPPTLPAAQPELPLELPRKPTMEK